MCFLLMSSGKKFMHNHLRIRGPVVSGLFYPADPAVLEREVSALLRVHRGASGQGRVTAMISPHAGYMYSGHTAGAAYARIEGEQYDTVVILSPSHREYFDGVSVYPGDAYQTPLGTIPIDEDLRRRILDTCSFVRASDAGHAEEHAIEVQLPFLQRAISDFSLLPLVFGHQKRSYCVELGAALGTLVKGTKTLLVASTDLSHYHAASEAERLDHVFVEDVREGNYDRLMTDLEKGATEACGGGPVVALLAAAQALGCRPMTILEQRTSGDVTGDTGSVVGYCSAVAYA
jgi:AmmeMemoRadiSam system protein B